MKVIEPYVRVEMFDGVKIMKNIEKACRTCYRSEDKISEDSYKKLLANCISRGHESVMEHEKITVQLVCDIGVYKDLTRHRAGTAFSIESTRYCSYNKDKFGNEIKFIRPCHINGKLYDFWKESCGQIETQYIQMAQAGAKPDQLRMILPHSTAALVTMTCNIREWRHIFSLRAQKMTHPTVQQVMIPLLRYFQKEMPDLFGDIPYNAEFNEQDYAKIIIEKETYN